MSAVVTLGETMALLTPPDRITAGSALWVGIGGAESNAAIGLARLGCDATWIGRVGDDDLGTAVVREIRAEGVTVLAGRDPDAPTGMMLKEVRGGRPRRVRYYRSTSAAARWCPEDLDPVVDVVAGARVLHLTGITPALGSGPLAVVRRAIAISRDAGVTVVLDVNHRRALWTDERARSVLTGLLGGVDVLLAGPDEAAMLLGEPEEDPSPQAGTDLATRLTALGPGTAVVKLGELGAAGADAHGAVVVPTTPVEVVDPVGAGDAFAAGFLERTLAGAPLADRIARGNACGGAVCRVRGDWEGLPFRDELDDPAPASAAVVR
ncbi:sugar kinase [Pseudonocardia alni]|uniref:2-dehydro-3-deoxygluconokinase n=1 Tax=Pseudonocardia alni TaxID=33907 RepID=A0A852W563_PSEA5|nr:sugar kinase [Pseudonocardia antarctica]NYG04237.1 2-dehydro-3-deoxygluconokinase [Pseudonocardia antarctica]